MEDLLKEALAEAKTFRQLALETAKANLAESFVPTLKSMLAKKLSESEDEEDEVDEMADPFNPTVREADEPAEDEKDDEMEEELDLEAIIRELEAESADAAPEDEDPSDDEMEDEAPKEARITREELEAYLREILGEIENSDAPEDEEDTEDVKDPKMEAIVARMQKELTEAKKVIRSLQKDMREVALVNSKLKYSGIIFRNYKGLNENQNLAILDSFDRANSIRETKLLYTTICETLNQNKAKSTVKKSLKESRASRVVNSTRPKTAIVDDPTVKRLKELAGLI